MQSLNDNVGGRANRWALLSAFAGHFLRRFSVGDSVACHETAASGYQLPESLTEFYSLCGNAADIWCRQDQWLKPDKLRESDGVLIFWVENQGNWRIGVRQSELALEDPPVVWDAAEWMYGVGAAGEFTVLSRSVSQFALNMIAYVAKFFGPGWQRPFGHTSDLDQFLDALAAEYKACQLQREWVCGRERYFQDEETFVEVNEGDGFVYPILKTPRAASRFSSLVRRVRFEWENPPAGSEAAVEVHRAPHWSRKL